MNITSAQYKNDPDGNQDHITAVIDDVTMFIPLDPSNRHHQAIQEWVAEGNTIQEAE